ncbi:MAG: BadF/BadG/BcrA/BcrD ATPase family protein [Bacteroidota bacterium]
MQKQAVLFGADGGGTKTMGLLTDLNGTPLAEAQVGGSNPNVVGFDRSAQNLSSLILRCCEKAGRAPSEIGAVVLGVAGTATPAIREKLSDDIRRRLSKHLPVLPPMAIEIDARIALEGAFGGGAGLILIAGTGSVVLGKRSDGEIFRVGGWGWILGDEGGGYYIGLEALKEVTKDFDGRSDAGALKELFSARFGLSSREKIIVAVYQEKFSIPSLAPLVLQAAEKNDPVSIRILQDSSALVAEQVLAAAKRIQEGETAKVVFVGGLIDHETVYAGILRETLRKTAPGIDVQPPDSSPVEGAILMARQLLTTKR